MIKIITPGGLRHDGARELCEYRLKLIKGQMPIQLLQLTAAKEKKGHEIERLQKEEAETILRSLSPQDLVIALDERGKDLNTEEMTQGLKRDMQHSGDIVYLVGGTNGLHESLLQRAKKTQRLSSITLTQDLALIILTEALYRSITLIKGGKRFHR